MAYNNDYGNYRSGYSTGGVGAYTDQRGNPRYASTDKERVTVIVDADGTKSTAIGCTPFHVTETEICRVELHPPLLPPVGYVYGADNARQRRSSSPVRGGYGYADHAYRIAPSTGANLRQQPHQTGHYSGTGYSDYNDYGNKPSRTAYSTGALPVRRDGRLSIPTDDMERALL